MAALEEASDIARTIVPSKIERQVVYQGKICGFIGCEKYSSFNYRGYKAGWCAKHRDRTAMIDVLHKTCILAGCSKIPNYGPEGNTKALYCVSHKEPAHINLRHQVCGFPGCGKQSTFGLEGTRKPLFCLLHKEPHHVNLKAKFCLSPGCRKQAVFGEMKGGASLYCGLHKEAHHINVRWKSCKFPGCEKQPNYGFEGDKKTIYCLIHKSEEMINLRKKSCSYIDESGPCKITPAYGNSNDKVALYCKNHATSSMIDVINDYCISCSKKIATFGYPEQHAVSCAKCAQKGMINLSTTKCNYVDVHGEKCTITARFNLPGYPRIRCTTHRLSGFICDPRTRCKTKSCFNFARFGVYKAKPTHCSLHQEPGQTNIAERKCISCGLLNFLDLAGLCEYCNHGNPFPILPNTTDADIPTTSPFYLSHSQAASSVPIDTPSSLPSISPSPASPSTNPPSTHRNPKLAKQNLIQDLLHHHNLIPDSVDLPLDKGECALYRPDFVFYGQPNPYHLVILEVDEDQHSSYACDCEQQRMVNLFHAQGGMPIHFIRYNPDAYKRPGQARRQTNEMSAKRHQVLLAYLRQALEINPLSQGVLVQVTYLFYDGYQPGEQARALLSPEPGYCALADFVIEED